VIFLFVIVVEVIMWSIAP